MATCRKYLLLIFCLSFSTVYTQAQLFHQKNYPQDYFIWPVKAQVAIVANFGEMRANHYHMGLDCRTDQRENVPVVAAADGYISRINIDANGFGRAIYIDHPNGYTTVYAHLNDFEPALHRYVIEEQYKQQSWKLTLSIPANRFPVKKGQFIAYSGNTGGSLGAHLHFEIRDTKSELVLNPLLFGLPIPDKVAPLISKLAMYDRTKSTYEQSPTTFSLNKAGNTYQVAGGAITSRSPKVSFAITATDACSGSNNPNGIYRALLQDNNQPICGFEMDSIHYDETRGLNAHIDFKTKSSGGNYLQHVSRLPGYVNSIYRSADSTNGIIDLSDGKLHALVIDVFDTEGNRSRLTFNAIYPGGSTKAIQTNQQNRLFRPEQENNVENDQFSIQMPAFHIYDAFTFNHQQSIASNGNPVCQIHTDKVPVHRYYPVRMNGSFPLSDTGFIIMKQTALGKTRYKKTIYVNGRYEAPAREFGTFELLCDKQPPTLTALDGFKDGCSVRGKKTIAFQATDNTETIARFQATIDDQWILCSNDKEKAFIYRIDEKCPAGEHLLRVVVTDLAGNQTQKTYRFTN
jgi:murein DD-endopeptidase MepM/ murein hydrolase activator NlpD